MVDDYFVFEKAGKQTEKMIEDLLKESSWASINIGNNYIPQIVFISQPLNRRASKIINGFIPHAKMPPRPRPPPRRHRPISAATAAGAFALVLPTVNIIRLITRGGSLLPLGYTCVISGVTFLLYGYDKMQARNLEWRVKETTLHSLELLGGWPGALIGQHFFQHKTRKTAFQIPFWGIVVGWQIVWWAVWTGGITMP
ncbi:DUF1294-domain-containing protein [Pleomassaria siparia CBS 279.74]|uniref:DUF1294-domain-containing protein n=1 Tax=Pleomassaria siparia CBS 279.74 TaxID=1314801 RepID=A0A6G1JYJ7_9PLEO|nr:DUF1294-domain-containing protein [Pleomassaria siparia CBS 279.74]